MFRFSAGYFLSAILLLAIEILIALYLRGGIIRPYIGDYLVVIMLYCFARAFLRGSSRSMAVSVLALAFVIEFCQLVHLVERLGWSGNRLARTVLGTGFDTVDLVLYVLGILTVLMVENAFGRKE